MNEIICDYDNFVAAPENTTIKESLKENLYSRIRQYKNKKKDNLRSQTNDDENDNGNPDVVGNAGTNDDIGEPSISQGLWQTKTVKIFQNRLSTKNIRSSNDGFLISSTGKKPNIPFESVLNDFGRNIKKKSNFMLSESQKHRVMKILGATGFAQYNIPNRKIKLAYGTNQPNLRKYLVHKTSPFKKKKEKLPNPKKFHGIKSGVKFMMMNPMITE